MRRWIALSLLSAACVTPPVSGLARVPAETPDECDKNCGAMGMQMSAVVLVANMAGCVCERPGAAPGRAGGASAVAAGATAALAAARRQQQQQQPPPYVPPPPTIPGH